MKKILVANRGEIALRIMRTCHEMGIGTVAVYSEADRYAPFVRYAREAVCIGPPPSKSSYLNIDKILAAAKEANADAIHPGYGFLSENPEFARSVTDAGLVFIGPPPSAMRMMGDKLAAKAAAKKYNIPMVPGGDRPVSGKTEAVKIADKIGYPVLIKAAAGGGGKGMRMVHSSGEMEEAIERAVSEAVSSFGNGMVFIEKYIVSPHHIEIQVLADNHGNVIHLFERDCSIQRRHQKVIEEAPSSLLTPAVRDRMGQCAVDIAKVCGYRSAGTVEFLVDEKLNFYFLEMNTRLQVEHPVTEFITGLDIVREQIHIARNEKLQIKQNELTMNGHSVEVRVYAEDPTNNFLPDIGKLSRYQRPMGADVRVDDGYEEGMEIPIYYDPMIAKLIVHAKNREDAIEKMIRAIDDYTIVGVETTLPFCRFTLSHDAFRSGKFDTHFVQNFFTPEMLNQADAGSEKTAAILAAMLFSKEKLPGVQGTGNQPTGNWIKRKELR